MLVLLLSPILAFMALSRIEAWRLNRALDALEARREALDVNAFDARPATDEQRRASHDYLEAARQIGQAYGTRFVSAGQTIEELCASASDADRTKHLATLHQVEDPYASALALLDRATAQDARGWDDADKPRPQSTDWMRERSIATVNAIRVGRLACTGDGEGAAAALLGTLRLRRMVTAGSFNALPQTAHALQSILTFTTPSVETLETLQKEYEAAARDDDLEQRMLYDRARWLQFMLPGEFSDVPEYFDRRTNPIEAIVMWLIRPFRNRGIVTDLAEFDEALNAARQPWPSKLDASQALEQKYQTSRAASPRRRGFLESVIRPSGRHAATLALGQLAPMGAESLARTRASIGVLAVARYRRAHHGALPDSLDALVPTYLTRLLVDPYTGSALKYRRDAAKYKLYSVGINRQDDGGVWEQRSDLQGSRRGNPKDVGVAVGAWADLSPR